MTEQRIVSHRGVRYRGFVSGAREPFFALAEAYFRKLPVPVVADLGSSNGRFWERTCNPRIILFDSQRSDRTATFDSIVWRAPQPLPLRDSSVGLVNLSHILEHLSVDSLLSVLGDSDRVLADGGLLVVSGPMLWEGFHDDITHDRPYGPWALQWYLTGRKGPISRTKVSDSYRELEIVFRLRTEPVLQEAGSELWVVDRAVALLRHGLAAIGVRRYTKTGYTLILQKCER